MPPHFDRLDALRISGSGGANRAMEAELKRIVPRALGAHLDERPQRVDEQNLRFAFDPALAWAALHYARTPSRIYWDLATVDAGRLDDLYEGVHALTQAEDATRWLEHDLGVSVEVRSIGDFPAGPLQVRGAVKNAVIEGARARGFALRLDPEHPDLVVSVSVEGEALRISLDLAGGSQHRRGYRQSIGEAPLKENLAAQMLILSRWDPRTEALLDPMMGAGTIPIEAALMARGEPLRREQAPPAHALPAFAELVSKPRPPLFPGTPPPVFGGDEDEDAVEAARANARRARVARESVFKVGEFDHIDEDALAEAWQAEGHEPADMTSGLVICNPPYGERLGDEDEVRELYARLVAWAQEFGSGWRFCFLAGHPALEETIPTQPRMKKPMSNGPIKAHLLVYDRLVD